MAILRPIHEKEKLATVIVENDKRHDLLAL